MTPARPEPAPATLTVVMAVYNEAATFGQVMAQVVAREIPGVAIDVVVVESASTDGTRAEVLEWADHPRVTVILEDAPRGKGHAVRRGLAAAHGDIVLIQDADLEYDVADYDRLLEPLLAGRATFVLGRRTAPPGSRGLRRAQPGFRAGHVLNAGHVVFLALFNVVYAQRLHDPFTMYKVFRRDAVEGLHLECDRFDFDWELTAKLIRCGHQPLEIPVTYRSRSFAQGKKVRMLRDPLTWVRACFKYRFARLHNRAPEP